MSNDQDLEAPGRFVSKDILARTPVCPPQLQQDQIIAMNHDASLTQDPVVETRFPPPPTSSELLDVEDFHPREASPDPHPPPAVQNIIDFEQVAQVA